MFLQVQFILVVNVVRSYPTDAGSTSITRQSLTMDQTPQIWMKQSRPSYFIHTRHNSLQVTTRHSTSQLITSHHTSLYVTTHYNSQHVTARHKSLQEVTTRHCTSRVMLLHYTVHVVLRLTRAWPKQVCSNGFAMTLNFLSLFSLFLVPLSVHVQFPA